MKLPHLNLKGSWKYGLGAFIIGVIAVAAMKGMKNKSFAARVNRSLYANTIKFPELVTKAGYNVPMFAPEHGDPDVTWVLPDLTDPKHDNVLYNKVPYQGMQSAPTPPNFEQMRPVGSFDRCAAGRTTYF